MADSFRTVLIEDPVLSGLTDRISYGVCKGGSNITQANFNAISSSNSQITFNVQVPSEQIVIDRKILFGATVKLSFTAGGTQNITVPAVGATAAYAAVINRVPPLGDSVITYGNSDSLQVFPLQSLMSVMTSTINNTTVSINIRDVLPSIMRMNDFRELYACNSFTNTLPDNAYLQYYDAVNCVNNPMGSYNNNTLDNDMEARGNLPITITNIVHNWINAEGNAVTDDSLISEEGSDTWTFDVSFTVAEPLLFSPYLFSDPKYNCQGFYGIQNLNFQFNVGDATRVWSTANPWISNITLASSGGFTGAKLFFTFLTPQPSQLLKSRNVVPYYEVPRYLSNSNANNPIVPSSRSAGNTSYIVAGILPSSQMLTSNSLQLNQIPDKLIITVRKPMNSQIWSDSMSQMVIQKISINFNNQSGLLSSASQYDLFRMSRENGSNQTFQEFVGFANSNTFTSSYPTATTGSVLILEFGKDIQLPDYFAPGSLGNFNLQFEVTVINQAIVSDTMDAPPLAVQTYYNVFTPEICVICMNSGVFVCDRGTSQVYLGILTKEDVLNTSGQEPYTRHDVKRLMGGSIGDNIKSSIGKALKSDIGKALLSKGIDMAANKLTGGDSSGGKVFNKNKMSKHLKH